MSQHNLRSITFVVLVLIIWTHSLNYPVLSILRICDVLTILLLLLSAMNKEIWRKPRNKFSLFTLFYFVGITFFLASDAEAIELKNLGLFYKILMPISIPVAISGLKLSRKQTVFLMMNYAVAVFLTTFWFYANYFLVKYGMVFWSVRISTPLTILYTNRFDSHLVSAYLAFNIVAIISVAYILKDRYIRIASACFCIYLAVPLILSGGRVGLFSIILTSFMLLLVKFSHNIRKILFYALPMALFVAAFYYLVHFLPIDPVLKRTFSIDLSGADASINARIAKFEDVLGIFNSIDTALFGKGLLGINFSWLDSIVAQILNTFGVIGGLLTLCYLYDSIRRICMSFNFTKRVLAVILPGLCYVFSNLSTEFYLVSRSVIPVAVWLTLVYLFMLPSNNRSSDYSIKNLLDVQVQK